MHRKTTKPAVYYSLDRAAKLINVRPQQLRQLIYEKRLLSDDELNLEVHPLTGAYYIPSSSLDRVKGLLPRRPKK